MEHGKDKCNLESSQFGVELTGIRWLNTSHNCDEVIKLPPIAKPWLWASDYKPSADEIMPPGVFQKEDCY